MEETKVKSIVLYCLGPEKGSDSEAAAGDDAEKSSGPTAAVTAVLDDQLPNIKLDRWSQSNTLLTLLSYVRL